MKYFFLLSLLFGCLIMKGQNDTVPNFKNQREQEDYWAKQRFTTAYKKEIYKRYTGEIKVLSATRYQYGVQYFEVAEQSAAIEQLFSLGILYPSLIAIASDGTDSVTEGQKTFANSFRASTFHISNIEELKFLQISPTVKRFRCLVSLEGIINPFVYLFELTNEHATQQTSMEDFIKGASLTYFKQGWIII